MDLGSAFERGRGGPGGWIIFYEPELHLARDVVVPDLVSWRRDRFAEVESEETFFITPPHWVSEVLSKSTARHDRTDKLSIYARERIPYVWLVDPVLSTLEVLLLEGERWVLHGTYKDDAIVHAPPFEAWDSSWARCGCPRRTRADGSGKDAAALSEQLRAEHR